MTRASRVDRVWAAITAHADALGVPVSLQVLCETAVARLPVTGVAVAISGGFTASELLCVTDPLSRRLEELQLTIGEGPTLEVLTGSSAILVDDLNTPRVQARWPLFAPEAVATGARAIVVLPLRIGAFALYVDHPGRLPAEDLAQAWVFSELALTLLLTEQSWIDPQTGDATGDPRFQTPPEVHQATGMISVQLGVSVAEAFARLRARAFAGDRALSALAADVVTRRIRFAPDHTE